MEQPVENKLDGKVAQCDVSTEASMSRPEEPVLPKLSAQEFRTFNRLADHMNYFVRTWRGSLWPSDVFTNFRTA